MYHLARVSSNSLTTKGKLERDKRSKAIPLGGNSVRKSSAPVDIMRRFKIGDAKAFEELVTNYRADVISYARAILGNHDDALEVSQEVFMRVYDKRECFEIGREFKPWLITITRNFCLTMMKRRKVVRFTPLFSENGSCTGEAEHCETSENLDPFASAAETERWELVTAALETLPSKDRQLIELRYFEGLSATEVARTLGMTPGAVRTRACRIIKKLRDYVKIQCEETDEDRETCEDIRQDQGDIQLSVPYE